MRCNPYNHLHKSFSKCLISKICSRVCLRVFLSCLFDLGRGEQVPSVTRAPVERRIVSGGQSSVTFECVFMTQGITVLSAYCHTLAMKTFCFTFSCQASFGSLGQSVKNTNPVYTLSLYKSWIFLFFYRFEAENILVLFLNFLNVVSILACIGSPFITMLLAFSILTYYSLTILTGTQFTPIKTVSGEP